MTAPSSPDQGDEIPAELEPEPGTEPEIEPDAESEARSDAELLQRYDVLHLRAPNAGPFTLSGTNTWVLGRRPAWVVDPGPLIDTHLRRLLDAIESRGGLGGVALTHDHEDHAEAVDELLARCPAPVAAGRGDTDVRLVEGERFGPFYPVATSGHSEDHFALIADGVCFTGDAVLGEGSVFVSPHRAAMSDYLLALTRLRLRDDFRVICPGHGPIVWDPSTKLEEYVNHRLDREHALIFAISQGARTERELLDEVWPEVSETMRPLAAVTLAAHLDKLDDEQILPDGVERPTFESFDS